MVERNAVEWNAALQPSAAARRSNKGAVDAPGDRDVTENLVWQTRAAPPTAYEDALGDALQRIFADGAEELADVVGRLNRTGPKPPGAEAWTEDLFAAEMKRLGA